MSETRLRSIQGTVIRVNGANTIKISTKVTKIHPLYRKRYSLLRQYIAHDPSNKVQVGDEVTIVACRPISKTKHWIVKQ